MQSALHNGLTLMASCSESVAAAPARKGTIELPRKLNEKRVLPTRNGEGKHRNGETTKYDLRNYSGIIIPKCVWPMNGLKRTMDFLFRKKFKEPLF